MESPSQLDIQLLNKPVLASSINKTKPTSVKLLFLELSKSNEAARNTLAADISNSSKQDSNSEAKTTSSNMPSKTVGYEGATEKSLNIESTKTNQVNPSLVDEEDDHDFSTTTTTTTGLQKTSKSELAPVALSTDAYAQSELPIFDPDTLSTTNGIAQMTSAIPVPLRKYGTTLSSASRPPQSSSSSPSSPSSPLSPSSLSLTLPQNTVSLYEGSASSLTSIGTFLIITITTIVLCFVL
ncbi:hypothetical protein LELG_04271 [Lodderomyces elongisporus NRRL YB-4239]|uniref:Uncharacterized protein n=1 Tax=Lodderomyces elongisporus (strain ATCC 11503 / CBS 2605 / JCM 1781 / NBRC 1676 / NRRL YB-4239) TaxID=379508 RepID=A5E3T3_LODEL|nr:hypothetical protein LELG_04271 [Lodderomyces elongisporus NRRL YB-4239]